MVNKQVMYDNYNKVKTNLIEKNKQQINRHNHTLNRLEETIIETYEDDINKYCTLNIPELKKVDEIEDIIFHKTIGDKELEIMKLFEAYLQIRDKVRNAKVINKEVKNSIISYKKYSFILKRFNDLLIDKLIEGYKFHPGFNIGAIYIKQKKQSDNAINWKASNEKKAELIANGKLPLKKYKDDEGNIIGDNGGEEWIVFRKLDGEDFRYLVHWEINKTKLKNRSNYVFQPTHSSTPTNGRKTFVERINDKLESDSLAHINYIR